MVHSFDDQLFGNLSGVLVEHLLLLILLQINWIELALDYWESTEFLYYASLPVGIDLGNFGMAED